MSNIMTAISTIAAAFSTVIAAIALIISVFTQKKIKQDNKKQTTILAFNNLQEQVLDKLAVVNKENAKCIINAIDENEDYKKAYDDYRTLIARLEHFAVGVNEQVYDFKLVDELAGTHLIYLYPKIQAIIEYANRTSKNNDNYKNYIDLVAKLIQNHPEISI